MKENHVMSVDSQNNLTTANLNEANINFMKNMDHKINQLGMMHLHNIKHMSKMRRNFLIVLLALIILAVAGLADELEFYFIISKEVANAVNKQNVNRVDLSDELTNLELGIIPDNQTATILSSVKTNNKKVVINDFFLKNISATQATLVAKSASGYYYYNSSVTVKFLASKLTL